MNHFELEKKKEIQQAGIDFHDLLRAKIMQTEHDLAEDIKKFNKLGHELMERHHEIIDAEQELVEAE